MVRNDSTASGGKEEGIRKGEEITTVYCRWAETPAAISRRELTNVAAAAGSANASRGTVAENCGDSGRKCTSRKSCRRADIRAFNSAVGSCFQ
jgi:hypothetical protein